MAQGGSVTRGKDQSTGQFSLCLRGVLILFEDTHAGISRLCAIAEDSTDATVLREPVRTRAPNHQRIVTKKTSRISPRNGRATHTVRELPTTSGTPARLNERRRYSAEMQPSKLTASRILRRHFWGQIRLPASLGRT